MEAELTVEVADGDEWEPIGGAVQSPEVLASVPWTCAPDAPALELEAFALGTRVTLRMSHEDTLRLWPDGDLVLSWRVERD